MDYEKEVMIQILPSVVDSIFNDWRISKIPEPYFEKGISDSLRLEKLKRYEKSLAEREKRIIEIKNDTSRIVIAIIDTIYAESLLKSSERIKDNGIEYIFDSITKKIEYKIDLNNFKENEKFRFKYSSEFPKGRKIFRTKYPFYFGGAISFSRIVFDKDKKYGIMSAGIAYEALNGYGFRIYLKRGKNDKWIIDKIKGTWIS
ncbi:hypothetical protein R3X25_11745 [Lutibacter sp. TH_r2]|uniref:hypothetical protein n=1 Tax=Lutibacter sp. TH_r2 TaxID=3082083 RepID=UPI0029555A6D|nr:hypothetical protein [Lutibacter sp. TH_r2]MDV7187956.1 hypothetical protein [Lutibacter sp. TH_r2]